MAGEPECAFGPSVSRAQQRKGRVERTLDVDAPLIGRDAKGLERAVLAQPLGLVNVLVAAVVPRAGVPLGVLVLHDAAERVEDGARGEVLRGDEVDEVALALLLLRGCEQLSLSGALGRGSTYALEDVVHVGVVLGEFGAEELKHVLVRALEDMGAVCFSHLCVVGSQRRGRPQRHTADRPRRDEAPPRLAEDPGADSTPHCDVFCGLH